MIFTVLVQVQTITDHFEPIQTDCVFPKRTLLVSMPIGALLIPTRQIQPLDSIEQQMINQLNPPRSLRTILLLCVLKVGVIIEKVNKKTERQRRVK